MTGSQQASQGFIQSQLQHLSSERRRVAQHSEAQRHSAEELQRHTIEPLHAQIAALQQRQVGLARQDCLAKARRGAWWRALSLVALWSDRGSRLKVWMFFVAMLFMLPHFFILSRFWWYALVAVIYAGLVARGLYRESKRTAADELAAIERFGTFKPGLLDVLNTDSGDSKYPYCVVNTAGQAGQYVSSYRFDSQRFGDQHGASFISFINPSDHRAALLVRFSRKGQPRVVIPVNNSKDSMPAWPVWKRLAESVQLQLDAQGHSESIISALHAFSAQAEAVDDAQGQIKLLDQRIQTLQQQEQAWADVALPAATLNQILMLLDLFKSGRHPAPRGMLLYGPPGTGKTLIARKLAQVNSCHFVSVTVGDLKGSHIGETAPKVKAVWERCRAEAPTLLFVDECESVFAARGSTESDSYGAELVQTFLAEWDGFNQAAGQVFVIGATNRYEFIDAAIMSRFTETIEIRGPDTEARARILRSEFQRARIQLEPSELMLRETSGMSGRDLNTLVAKAVAASLLGGVTEEVVVAEARRLRGKSSTSVTSQGWDSLVLPAPILQELQGLGQELIHAEEMRKLGVGVPRGIILYGPPGTGKTQIARVLASESGLSFLAAGSSELKAGYIGQSGGKVSQLFEKARAQAPCILFLDEIDTIAASRNGGGDSFTQEIVAQLLQEIDGVKSRPGQVFVLAASNYLDHIDSALLSRMERKIHIDLPDQAARAQILQLQLTGKSVDFELAEVAGRLAEQTAGLSGRDLQSLVTAATRRAVQRAVAQQGDPRLFRLTSADLQAQLS